jgi:hypothetical protein
MDQIHPFCIRSYQILAPAKLNSQFLLFHKSPCCSNSSYKYIYIYYIIYTFFLLSYLTIFNPHMLNSPISVAELNVLAKSWFVQRRRPRCGGRIVEQSPSALADGTPLDCRNGSDGLSWLVVWNMTFMSVHILGIITPTDELIFFRGVAQPQTS